MQLKPFLLDEWLNAHEPSISFNLAASTGRAWHASELLEFAGEEGRVRVLDCALRYGRPAGDNSLREAIAEMQGVSADRVLVVTGASEALLVLFWLAAEPEANIIIPSPGYPPFSALPESLGLETRFYNISKERQFVIDLEEIEQLADANTKLILVNSPHNPTGTTLSDAEFDRLAAFASMRRIQLVSDEVYRPIYHARKTLSAARLPDVTVINDFSKALSFSGLRIGWMIEHDAARRERYLNARCYFSISNNVLGEALAEIVVRNRDVILREAQETASRNLALLDAFMAEHRATFGWIRPQGGVTAFPWLVGESAARPFCRRAVEIGVLFAPGDCFGAPEHFRLGFAASGNRFGEALARVGELGSVMTAS